MRDKVQQIYQEQGRLPAGITLETPAVYANMQGTGELWLNADGLPARLIINLNLPAEGQRGRVTAVVTSDFTNFNTTNIATAITSTTNTDCDGLSDEEEAEWGSCAYLGAPKNCDGVVDSTDSDADGLGDGTEAHNLDTPVAFDAAAEDSIIRIAGTCSGVSTINALTQTAYISKSLTLEGGYSIDQSWGLAAPTTHNHSGCAGNGRVVLLEGTGPEVTLRHLTLTGGQVNDEGGGVYVNGSLHLTLDHVIVANNAAESGGGLYLRGTTEIINSTIQQNNATTYGGGIGVTGEVTITNSTINHNTAAGAGALIGGGSVTINNSTISNNSANVESGALFFIGDEINIALYDYCRK